MGRGAQLQDSLAAQTAHGSICVVGGGEEGKRAEKRSTPVQSVRPRAKYQSLPVFHLLRDFRKFVLYKKYIYIIKRLIKIIKSPYNEKVPIMDPQTTD